ncbi:MAG TPA: sugar phosphate nucleotidyltransferase [Candidatus Saccharicenans sp.]|nr:sugar phosphate nucleotidyltransferase [Candidatus Saccharicenans sp.]HOL45037.1 sugar phosphate nucleotidyltransferase [Candidatus Saccharicenans sp.]HOP60399.1 sugar phosphate nucleotidyltransferase [Candidatus Saccharicenans sp.]HPP23569.1 sugar phosphate nucleotidyltransferase [Candidatus Saccharicenans sp.]
MGKQEKRSKRKGDKLPDLRVVILAGGSGTRFWPLSRRKNPKQYLTIVGGKKLVEQTVDRVKGLVPVDNLYTVAVSWQSRKLEKILPALPRKNLLTEPQARNTAPSVLLATATIYLDNPEAVIAFLPADHYIQEVQLFRQKLQAAAAAAYKFKKIIMFGIPPTSPATGYGYLHCPDVSFKTLCGEKFYTVSGFKEKPDLPTALDFIQSGEYYWNSGIFLWRADVFEESLRKYTPELFSAWIKILEALKKGKRQTLARIFRELPAQSIDYALIEKVRGSLMARGDFGWSDLGSWSSLYELHRQDENCNVANGSIVSLDSKNCLVLNPGQLTALIGVEDLIIVNSKDALLVCRREADQRVKELVEKLGKEQPEHV